eukprot:scaffold156888_cov47-Prasinocladus_malaysianus.AAC.2
MNAAISGPSRNALRLQQCQFCPKIECGSLNVEPPLHVLVHAYKVSHMLWHSHRYRRDCCHCRSPSEFGVVPYRTTTVKDLPNSWPPPALREYECSYSLRPPARHRRCRARRRLLPEAGAPTPVSSSKLQHFGTVTSKYVAALPGLQLPRDRLCTKYGYTSSSSPIESQFARRANNSH